IRVTNFVTKNILEESKNFKGERKKHQGIRKKLLRTEFNCQYLIAHELHEIRGLQQWRHKAEQRGQN
ncbi:MAG: hypothetical protein ACOCN1_08425, partial [Bacteroidales bacterium]